MKNNVNVIIVNYNCWEDTIECVESILQSSYSNFTIHIVDNNSSDNSILSIENYLAKNNQEFISIDSSIFKKNLNVNSKIILIKHDKNDGFSAGNNVVIKKLITDNKEEFVWLINPDTVVEKEVMQDLVKLAKTNQKAIIGNIINLLNNPTEVLFYGGFKVKKFIHGVKRVTREEEIDDIDAISGACLFTSVDTFNTIGILPEEYFMYWEETDFCRKAKNNGFNFKINKNSIVYDKVGSSSNSNFLREYLYLLNGLRFHLKYNKKTFLFIYLSSIIKLLKGLLFDDKIKKKALSYAHVDFISFILKNNLNVKKRFK